MTPPPEASDSGRALRILAWGVLGAGGLAVAALSTTMGRLVSDPHQSTLLQMKNIETALLNFKVKYHRYPSTEEGLRALIEPPPLPSGRTPGPFLDDPRLLEDIWGTPLLYAGEPRQGDGMAEAGHRGRSHPVVPYLPPSHPYVLLSLGEDRALGGSDAAADFCNWDG